MDFALACSIALESATACNVLRDRWFPPHFAVHTDFSITARDATVETARVQSPIWPACWVQCTDWSRRSNAEAVQNIWNVHIQELSFVPMEVRSGYVRHAIQMMWMPCGLKRVSFVLMNHIAGCPALPGRSSSGSRNQPSLRSMRLGGVLTMQMSFDVTSSGFFINSSLAPVLRFRRRFKSVCNVLKDTGTRGFADTWMTAQWNRWAVVTQMGPTGPITSLEPWTNWIPQIFMGSIGAKRCDVPTQRVCAGRSPSLPMAWTRHCSPPSFASTVTPSTCKYSQLHTNAFLTTTTTNTNTTITLQHDSNQHVRVGASAVTSPWM